MPKFRKTYAAVVTLLSVLWITVGAVASDQKTEESVNEFRVDIPVSGDETQSPEAAMKNKLLLEKLIKMGRARSQGCTRCHGRVGMQSLARASHWKGSITEFVATQLTAFRDGKRSHEVMSSIAQNLSDQDIALIAAWYQSVSPKTD